MPEPDSARGIRTNFGLANQWPKATAGVEGGHGCAGTGSDNLYLRLRSCLVGAIYGEELERRLFPCSVRKPSGQISKWNKVRKQGGEKEMEKSCIGGK